MSSYSWPSGLSVKREWAQLCPPVYVDARKGAMFSSFTNSKKCILTRTTPGASSFLVLLLVRPSCAPSGGSYLESHLGWGIHVDGWKTGSIFSSLVKLLKAFPCVYNRFSYLFFPLSSSPRRDNWTVWFPLNVMYHMQMKHNRKMH